MIFDVRFSGSEFQKGGIDKEWDAYVKKVSEPTLGLDANIKIWQKWYDKYTK